MTGGPRRNLLATPAGRRALFALLYLSEGAPIGFVWWAMPTLLSGLGFEIDAITTLTTIATAPWILKFLIAPAIDAGVNRAVPLKRWILVCQLAMAGALAPLALVDWSAQFQVVVAFVLVHAIFAAVQDVGIDTLAIHAVPRAELGRINGWMQAGMLTGRASVAAGATLAASAFGHPGPAVLFLVVLIALPALALVLAVEEPRIERAPVRARAVVAHVATRAGLAGLAVALLIGAGFEFFGVSAGPRLLDLGNSEATVAVFYGLLAPAGLALGALAGGWLGDRVGPLGGTSMSLAVLTGVLAWIAVGTAAPGVSGAALAWFVAGYVGIGALTATSYALFMTLSRGEYAATRFSLFMAMTNACEAWSAFVGGRFAQHDYGVTLIALSAVACFAAVPLYVLRGVTPPRRRPA